LTRYALFSRFQLYNYRLGKVVLDATDIKEGAEWHTGITGGADKVQWRIWWKNYWDEPTRTWLRWVVREKYYGKDWSGWMDKRKPLEFTLDPKQDIELTQDDYLPTSSAWQYYEMVIELYKVEDDVRTMTDKLRIFIDNDTLTLTVTCERPYPPPPLPSATMIIDNDLAVDVTLTWSTGSYSIPAGQFRGVTVPIDDTLVTSRGIFKETGTNKLVVKPEYDGKWFHVVPVEKPKVRIVSYDIPDELPAGAWITGKVVARNDGKAGGKCRLVFHFVWKEKDIYYVSDEVYLNPGQEMEVDLSKAYIKMPEEDTVIEMRGEHLENSKWIVDDKKTH